jgi:hypothetical protein
MVDRSRAPKAPVCKLELPLMVPVYHRQRAHPDLGEFRIWSLRARSDVSGQTIGRVMALNRLVSEALLPVRRPGVKPAPGPPPSQARSRHQDWGMDGRRLDGALDGVPSWRLRLLTGDSRTMLAGMIAPHGRHRGGPHGAVYGVPARWRARVARLRQQGGLYVSRL